MNYRKGANADLPNHSGWDDVAKIRRRKAEQALRSEMAKVLEEQGALVELELDGLLKQDYDAYWQRKNELERKQ